MVLFIGFLTVVFNRIADMAIENGMLQVPDEVDVGGVAVPAAYVVGIMCLALAFLVNKLSSGPSQPCEGAVFITGCDSGMGEATALHFASLGFHVYAGCFFPASEAKLKANVVRTDAKHAPASADKITYVALDVTKDDSVQAAFDFISKDLNTTCTGVNKLVGIINCAGIAVTGPIEYLPVAMYQKQLDVNFFGYVRVAQKFLPLLRATAEDPAARRGRVVFVGTGGGVCTPTPGLLSAYMASKFAGEAYIQVLRTEMALQGKRIDACMLNPGVVKPTGLADDGKANMERFWAAVGEQAKDEYKWLFDRFEQFNEEQPGSHPHNVALGMEEIMRVGRPMVNYCVGFDSKAANFMGILPSRFTEWVYRAAIFQETAWTPK
jgi:NAD(P)-dependent dehydrogenase (short-subunit alcohol dehydrogenase family)